MFAHRGLLSVVDAMYLGCVFNATPLVDTRIRHRTPRAGEDPVGPPTEQEHVGALVDLI
jgi:hypothetical protein